MPEASDQLRRLRVARDTGHLPRDLGRWAVMQIEVLEFGAFAVRTRELQAAAQLIPGSLWARARALEALIRDVRALEARGNDLPLDGDTPSGFVARALYVDPDCPSSWRHLLRLLTSDSTPHLRVTTQAVR